MNSHITSDIIIIKGTSSISNFMVNVVKAFSNSTMEVYNLKQGSLQSMLSIVTFSLHLLFEFPS